MSGEQFFCLWLRCVWRALQCKRVYAWGRRGGTLKLLQGLRAQRKWRALRLTKQGWEAGFCMLVPSACSCDILLPQVRLGDGGGQLAAPPGAVSGLFLRLDGIKTQPPSCSC